MLNGKNGWISMWRRTLDSSVWINHNVMRVWTYCLLKATHEPYEALVGHQKVPLKPGQFIFGHHEAARHIGLGVQALRNAMRSLIVDRITIFSTNKYSVVTILNWEPYQNPKPKQNKQKTNKKQHTITLIKKEHIVEIVKHLNEKTGRDFKPITIKTVKLIQTRAKEGFTVDDFKKVINHKVKKWGGDPKMEEYLRPETLFGNKFEGYLNDTPVEKPRTYTDDFKPKEEE